MNPSVRASTTDTGKRGEDLICSRLQQNGFRILDRNVRERFAEIDIVAERDSIIVFVEVRTRSDIRLGHPAETVTLKKQQHIRRAAEAYLIRHRLTDRPVRFDVATIIWQGNIHEYFENAF